MPDSFCYLFTYPLEDKTDDDTESKDINAAESTPDGVEHTPDDVENQFDDYAQNTSVRSVSQWKIFQS